jgi:hypothetical protein
MSNSDARRYASPARPHAAEPQRRLTPNLARARSLRRRGAAQASTPSTPAASQLRPQPLTTHQRVPTRRKPSQRVGGPAVDNTRGQTEHSMLTRRCLTQPSPSRQLSPSCVKHTTNKRVSRRPDTRDSLCNPKDASTDLSMIQHARFFKLTRVST